MNVPRIAGIALAAIFSVTSLAAQTIGVNVLLKSKPTETILADLGKYGTVRDVIPEISAVTMQIKSAKLPTIQALSYVAAANKDQPRSQGPEPTADAPTNFDGGFSTWDLDSINVTSQPGLATRAVAYDGAGVYVAVLDSGLVNNWPSYFIENRIATQYAISFGGGGGDVGFVSQQPNKWEEDQNSHGTHVTSTILGYRYGTASINGVAPAATVIPVKVLNQNGSGWSSVIARGIVYVADLKVNTLGTAPVVINMSLGGSVGDAMEKAAIDYAISKGVIVVASAGNRGTAGMGYPGAYDEVISAAASGWIGEWTASNWWYGIDVPETGAANFYIATFSSRQKAGQFLDVAAPGSWVLGPYQVNGQISYYFLGGTSMAAPHVTGTAALLLQKNGTLTQAQVESTLKTTALPLAPGCRSVKDPSGVASNICWGSDATGSGIIQADAALNATVAQ